MDTMSLLPLSSVAESADDDSIKEESLMIIHIILLLMVMDSGHHGGAAVGDGSAPKKINQALIRAQGLASYYIHACHHHSHDEEDDGDQEDCPPPPLLLLLAGVDRQRRLNLDRIVFITSHFIHCEPPPEVRTTTKTSPRLKRALLAQNHKWPKAK